MDTEERDHKKTSKVRTKKVWTSTLLTYSKFLAAMSSSRSDDVTKCVCVCVWSHFVQYGEFQAIEAR